jgi:hypothetical protein
VTASDVPTGTPSVADVSDGAFEDPDNRANWSAERAGSLVATPQMGSAEHPPLGDAPGESVHS